jgi:hypothetical protein
MTRDVVGPALCFLLLAVAQALLIVFGLMVIDDIAFTLTGAVLTHMPLAFTRVAISWACLVLSIISGIAACRTAVWLSEKD